MSNDVQRELHSRAGTSIGRKNGVIKQTVNWKGEGEARSENHKSTVKETVFNLLSSMHTIVLLFISTGLWGLLKSTPVITDKGPRPSKYTAQLFDCGVLGKIQLFQIPETCNEASKEREMAVLQETYVLSPRK